MRFASIGYGVLALVGTAAFGLWSTFRAFDGDARARRAALSARIEPVADEDAAWPGRYELGAESITFFPGGRFKEQCLGAPDGDLPSFCERSGAWRRNGSAILLSSEDGARELELGRLDGSYVLLGEFSTWRRVP